VNNSFHCGKKSNNKTSGKKTMGKIIIAYKILPSESTIDLKLLEEKIKKLISDYSSNHKFAEEPIAFGLSALKVTMIVPEEEGIIEKMESRLNELEEIGQIETLGVTRL
jgi:elongation factor 1-beta